MRKSAQILVLQRVLENRKGENAGNSKSAGVLSAVKPVARVVRKSFFPVVGAVSAANELHKYNSGTGVLDREGNRKSRLALALNLAGEASYFIPGFGWLAGMGLQALGGVAQNKENRRYYTNMSRMQQLGINPSNPLGLKAAAQQAYKQAQEQRLGLDAGGYPVENWEQFLAENEQGARFMSYLGAGSGAWALKPSLMNMSRRSRINNINKQLARMPKGRVTSQYQQLAKLRLKRLKLNKALAHVKWFRSVFGAAAIAASIPGLLPQVPKEQYNPYENKFNYSEQQG